MSRSLPIFLIALFGVGCYNFQSEEAQYPYSRQLLEKSACTDDVQCSEGFICDRESYEYVGKCTSVIRTEEHGYEDRRPAR